MRCPICKKPVTLDDPESPFCSERCRIVDLGNWSSEKYVISSPADPMEIVRETVRPNGFHQHDDNYDDEFEENE